MSLIADIWMAWAPSRPFLLPSLDNYLTCDFVSQQASIRTINCLSAHQSPVGGAIPVASGQEAAATNGNSILGSGANFLTKCNNHVERAVLRRRALGVAKVVAHEGGLRQEEDFCEANAFQKSSYYNYFIIMNYFALSPTRPIPTQQLPQTHSPLSSLPTPLILRAISMALTNSLNNYHNVVLSSSPQLEPIKQAENGCGGGSIPQEAPPCGPEVHSLTRLPVQAQNKIVPKQNCLPPRRDHLSRAKTNHHLSTSEEHVEERPQKTQPTREERTRKKSAVESVRTEVPARPVPQPSIDLIETAYLPEFGLDREELRGIWEKLESRRVGEWNEKVKLRQDKRELRLLGC